MLKIGSYNELVVDSEVEFGLYLHSDDERILLPQKYAPEDLKVGDTIDVFVYTDSEDRPIATTLKPNGVVGDFVYMEAKDVTSFGTFMDWGLEKDLLVPKSEQQDRMVPGKKYLIKVLLDEKTDRVYGTNKISVNCDKDLTELNELQKVDLLIHSQTNIGIMAVINNRYFGMMYLNETYKELSVGERVTGYIMRLREDGKIDLTLKKPGYNSVSGSAETILAKLQDAGGELPFHDKSDPDDIKRTFSMSKKEFKKAIGGLLKHGLIEIEKTGIKIK
jgi:predicted RNA-binding protein (virulence factor B family)